MPFTPLPLAAIEAGMRESLKAYSFPCRNESAEKHCLASIESDLETLRVIQQMIASW